MIFRITHQQPRHTASHRKKFWEEVADRQFESMDEEAKAQWAELR